MDPYKSIKKLDPYQLLGPTRVVVATSIIGILIIILNMEKNN